MEQLEILSYFNSKWENELPLLSLWCASGIGKFWVMTTFTQCKQRAVKCELDLCQVYEIFNQFEMFAIRLLLFNCCKTSIVTQTGS